MIWIVIYLSDVRNVVDGKASGFEASPPLRHSEGQHVGKECR